MGEIVTNPPTTPNNVSDSWQPLLDRDQTGLVGIVNISLINWSGSISTLPEIGAGSIIEIDGSLARFPVNEAIGGTYSDGIIYLKFVVSGSTVTAEWTDEAPSWDHPKQGFYNGVGEKYSGHNMLAAPPNYTDRLQYANDQNGDLYQTGPAEFHIDSNGYFDRNLHADGHLYIAQTSDLIGNVKAEDGIEITGVNMRMKLFTGITQGDGDISITHGVDWNTIYGCFVMCNFQSNRWDQISVANILISENQIDLGTNYDDKDYRLLLMYGSL